MDKDSQLSSSNLTEPELQGLQRKRAANYAAAGSTTEQTELGHGHFDVHNVFVVQLVDDVVAVATTERSNYGN